MFYGHFNTHHLSRLAMTVLMRSNDVCLYEAQNYHQILTLSVLSIEKTNILADLNIRCSIILNNQIPHIFV